MKSTSSFNSLVNVEDLHLSFGLRMHGVTSLRSQFVSFMRNPLANLLHTREAHHVLRGISLTAKQGDRIALIGKNGEGKSTLCRCLAGFYRPTKGKIEVQGRVRSILDPAAIIYPELTGRENAQILAALLYPELGETLAERIDEALQFSGLGAFLDTPFRYYSNGMQTRLCLSIATCAPADIFILDEVFDGADSEFRERISRRIIDLISQSGVVFFVSHSEAQVRRVCNRAIFIDSGRIQVDGSVDEVYRVYNGFIENQLLSH